MSPSPFRRTCIFVCLLLLLAFLTLPPGDARPAAAQEIKQPPGPGDPVMTFGTKKFRHDHGIMAVAYSSDGKLIASSSEDSTIRVWDAVTGVEKNRWHLEFANGIAFSAKGTHLASTGESGIYFWDWGKGQGPTLFAESDEKTDPLLPNRFMSIDLSSDGRFVAAGSDGGTVRVWTTDDKTEWFRIKGTKPLAFAEHAIVRFSHDGKLLALWGPDAKIQIWDVAAKTKVRLLDVPKGSVLSLAFSDEDKSLASGGADGKLRLWSVDKGNELLCLGNQNDACEHVAFSPTEKTLVSGYEGGRLCIWSLPKGNLLREIQGNPSGFAGLVFSPDGKTLAAGGENSAIQFWNAATGEFQTPGPGHLGKIHAVAFSPDGSRLATASVDGTARLWDRVTGNELRVFKGHVGPIWALAYVADGKHIATGGGDGTIRVWDINSGKQKASWQGHGGKNISGLACCDGGKVLASAGPDGVRFWQLPGGKELLHEKESWGLAGSADGRTVAAAGKDHITIWNVAKMKKVRTLQTNGLNNLKVGALSADGRMLAGTAITADYKKKTFVIIEVASGKTVISQDHWYDTFHLSFASRGKALFASNVMKGAVIVWDLPLNEALKSYVAGPGTIFSLASSADGTMLVTGHGDSMARLWKVSVSEIVPKAHLDLDMKQCELLWKALAGEPKAAFNAVWGLVANPNTAVVVLKDNLKPVAVVDQKAIAKHIGELGSEIFEARKRAFAALQDIGDQAVPALEERLKQPKSLEESMAIEKLLQAAETCTSEQLQMLRAIQALEYIGTAGAKSVLQKMASGAAGSRITADAKASLERLGK